MPIFRGINCWWKFSAFMILFSVISIAVMAGLYVVIGLFAGIAVIGLLMMILYFIIDLYGDKLLSASGYWLNETDQKSVESIKLTYIEK
jgi:hypothetical protein